MVFDDNIAHLEALISCIGSGLMKSIGIIIINHIKSERGNFGIKMKLALSTIKYYYEAMLIHFLETYTCGISTHLARKPAYSRDPRGRTSIGYAAPTELPV